MIYQAARRCVSQSSNGDPKPRETLIWRESVKAQLILVLLITRYTYYYVLHDRRAVYILTLKVSTFPKSATCVAEIGQ